MAIYRPTYCEPFLSTEDFSTITASNPLYLYCKIASSNFDVTGYSIKLLGPNNELLFPKAESNTLTMDTISLISNLAPDPTSLDTNSGRNGTFLKIPFYYGSSSVPTPAGSTLYRNQISANASEPTARKVPLYNGNDYKWIITLYQLENNGIPINVNYYDIILTTGVIAGSTSKRLQTMPSDKILSDYYIQPVQIDGVSTSGDLMSQRAASWVHSGAITPVGSRGRIYTYDNTLGHLYPQLSVEGAWDNIINRTLWLAGADDAANGFQVFKQSGNWDDLQTTQKADMMPYGAIPWEWVTTPANLGQSYGQQEYWITKDNYEASAGVFYPFDTQKNLTLSSSAHQENMGHDGNTSVPSAPIVLTEMQWWFKQGGAIYYTTDGGLTYEDSGITDAVQFFSLPYKDSSDVLHNRLWVVRGNNSNPAGLTLYYLNVETSTTEWNSAGTLFAAYTGSFVQPPTYIMPTPSFHNSTEGWIYWCGWSNPSGSQSSPINQNYTVFLGAITQDENNPYKQYGPSIDFSLSWTFWERGVAVMTGFVPGFYKSISGTMAIGTMWVCYSSDDIDSEGVAFAVLSVDSNGVYGFSKWGGDSDYRSVYRITDFPRTLFRPLGFPYCPAGDGEKIFKPVFYCLPDGRITDFEGDTFFIENGCVIRENVFVYTKTADGSLYYRTVFPSGGSSAPWTSCADNPLISIGSSAVSPPCVSPIAETTMPVASLLVQNYNTSILMLWNDSTSKFEGEQLFTDSLYRYSGISWSGSLNGGTPEEGIFVGALNAGAVPGLSGLGWVKFSVDSFWDEFAQASPMSVPVADSQRIILNYQPVTNTNNLVSLSLEPFAGDSPFNGVYSPSFSTTLFLSNRTTETSNMNQAVWVKVTVYWRRTVDADTWGELLTKIIMIDPNSRYSIYGQNRSWAGQNVQINIDSDNNQGGAINTTAFKFIMEKPIRLYELDDTSNEDINTTAILFYNNPSNTLKEFIPAETLFVKPLVGMENGNIIKFSSTAWGVISKMDAVTWSVNVGSAAIIPPDLKEGDTPYSICSCFRTSDENPFSGAAKPIITITPSISGHRVDCSATYTQSTFVQWRTYQWFLASADGTEIYDQTPVGYDNNIKATFYGLKNGVSYKIILTIETNDNRVFAEETTIGPIERSFAKADWLSAESDCNGYYTDSADGDRGSNVVTISMGGRVGDLYKCEIWPTGDGEEPIYHLVGEGVYGTVKDYNVANHRWYKYVFRCVEDDIDYVVPVQTSWAGWTITELTPAGKNGHLLSYEADSTDVWKFKYNISTGNQTQNLSKTSHDTLGRFPYFSFGRTNYESGSVTCLLGREMIPFNLSPNKPEYVYKDGQWQWEYVGSRPEPDSNRIYRGGYMERLPNGQTGFRDLGSNEKINMLNQWKKFCASGNPKLLKDEKGNSYIVQILNTSSETQNNIYGRPEQISFEWQQIKEARDIIATYNKRPDFVIDAYNASASLTITITYINGESTVLTDYHGSQTPVAFDGVQSVVFSTTSTVDLGFHSERGYYEEELVSNMGLEIPSEHVVFPARLTHIVVH